MENILSFVMSENLGKILDYRNTFWYNKFGSSCPGPHCWGHRYHCLFWWTIFWCASKQVWQILIVVIFNFQPCQ